jgi:glycerophosphoryl diester phosphodiesterase
MQIAGHRGAAGLAPENTRASFRLAISNGADWVEFDVRTTSDGHVVVFHDRNTLRMSGRPYVISKTPLAKLQRLNLRGGQSIPTLTEALNTVGGHAKILIEIKTAGCAQAIVNNIARLVKKGARYHEFMIASFNPERLREVRRLNEHIPLLLFMRPHKSFSFKNLTGLELKAVGFYHRFLPQRAIDQAHMHGLEVFVYVVNSRLRAKWFARHGADCVITNRPDLLREI